MVSTHLKNISQMGSFPQVGVKIKKMKPPPSLWFISVSYFSTCESNLLKYPITHPWDWYIYLHDFPIKINHSWIGKYTTHGWYEYGHVPVPPVNFLRQNTSTVYSVKCKFDVNNIKCNPMSKENKEIISHVCLSRIQVQEVQPINTKHPASKLSGDMFIPPSIGNPYDRYINPNYWVHNHPRLYGNKFR